MEYVKEFATPQNLQKNKYVDLKQITKDDYFDKSGKLQPGYKTHFNITHIAIIALMEWAKSHPKLSNPAFSQYNLLSIEFKTGYTYELQTLLAAMHKDWLLRDLKRQIMNTLLLSKGTTLREQDEQVAAKTKKQARLKNLFAVNTHMRKTRGRWCWSFLAATQIQQWWLRMKHAQFCVVLNICQQIDRTMRSSHPNFDSAKIFGVGVHMPTKHKTLLKIQTDIMDKVDQRRKICQIMSNQFVKKIISGVLYTPCAKRAPRGTAATVIEDADFPSSTKEQIDHGETVYSYLKYTPASRWAADGGTERYLCKTCATIDHSYPGSGRASGNLNHPRWAAQCSGCGKKNQYYCPIPPTPPPTSCEFGSEDVFQETRPPTDVSAASRKLGWDDIFQDTRQALASSPKNKPATTRPTTQKKLSFWEKWMVRLGLTRN